jgi:hypothetical protein
MMTLTSRLNVSILSLLLLIPFQAAQSQDGQQKTNIPLVTRHKNFKTDSVGGNRLAASYRAVELSEPTGPHFAQAIEYYKKGASAAPEILRELDLEIAEFPEGVSSRVVKARTLKGIDRCPEALAVLTELETITSRNSEIVGDAEFLRAECLYLTGKYFEANQSLTAFWAFFQANPTSKKKSEQLAAAVEKALPEKRTQP